MSENKNQDYSDYSFAGQHDNEAVEAMWRLHPITMRKGLLLFAILFCLLSLPYLLFPSQTILFMLIPLGAILGAVAVFKEWIKWYYTLILVTDMRFLLLRQKGFFSNSVIEVELSKIQNVNYQIDGFEQTVLGFGTINVQTFAGDLVVTYVNKPKGVQNTVNHAIHRYKEQHGENS